MFEYHSTKYQTILALALTMNRSLCKAKNAGTRPEWILGIVEVEYIIHLENSLWFFFVTKLKTLLNDSYPKVITQLQPAGIRHARISPVLQGSQNNSQAVNSANSVSQAIQIGYLDPILFQNFRNSTKTGIHFIEPLRPNIRHCATCVTEHKAKILKGIDLVSTTTNCQTYEKHQS